MLCATARRSAGEVKFGASLALLTSEDPSFNFQLIEKKHINIVKYNRIYKKMSLDVSLTPWSRPMNNHDGPLLS